MENEIVKSIDREKIKAEVINQVIALSEKEIGYHEKGINITKYAQRDFPGFQGKNWRTTTHFHLFTCFTNSFAQKNTTGLHI